jgi:hypothetical protein
MMKVVSAKEEKRELKVLQVPIVQMRQENLFVREKKKDANHSDQSRNA